MAEAAGYVWVASPNGGAVFQVDPTKETVIDTIPVGGEPGSLVTGGGALYIASTIGATVERIDPVSSTVTWTAHLEQANPVSMAFGDNGLWVADSADQALLELSPLSGSLLRRFPLGLRPTAIADGDGLIWVAAYDTGTIEGIDPITGQTVGTASVGDGPVSLAFSAGDLWVANSLDGTVSVIDTEDFTVVSTIATGSGPTAVVASKGGIWVANQYSGTATRISPQRLVVVTTVPVGESPAALALGPSEVWVSASVPPANHKGGTLVLTSSAQFTTIDPALYSAVEGFAFMRLAYDTLVTFEPTAGPSGLRLVPDLALQIPVPSDGGRTYSFRIRPDIRYADGKVVRASDFLRGIERLFEMGSPAVDYYSGIVGAQACLENPKHCDLSAGVVTEDSTGSLIFHLTAPDPDFLYKLTLYAYNAPVPPGTPDDDVGTHPVPGTGPYRLAVVTPLEEVFERNPFFREWSRAAQPDGNPNVVIWRLSPSPKEEVSAIEQGKADWTWDPIPPAELRVLQVEYPAQVHPNPASAVEFDALNTGAAPFNNLRVRQALNYAIDRRKIAQWYGGLMAATPTCQPLLPGLLGYVRYCPYTRDPQSNGLWTAPNLPLAKKLVAESGTKGELVNVWGVSDGTVPTQEPAYIAQVLRSLGYRTTFRVAASWTVQGLQPQLQMSAIGDWSPDYPDPSSYIPEFFACDGANGNGYYCDPALDREMTQATLLEQQDPAQAAALWTKVDHYLTDQAVWLPTVDLYWVDFTSKRLKNYEFNPVWGFVADQAVLP